MHSACQVYAFTLQFKKFYCYTLTTLRLYVVINGVVIISTSCRESLNVCRLLQKIFSIKQQISCSSQRLINIRSELRLMVQKVQLKLEWHPYINTSLVLANENNKVGNSFLEPASGKIQAGK